MDTILTKMRAVMTTWHNIVVQLRNAVNAEKTILGEMN